MEDYKNIFSDGTQETSNEDKNVTVPDFTSTPDEKTYTQVIIKDNEEKLEEIEESILSALQDGGSEIPTSDMYGIVQDIKSDTSDIRARSIEAVEEIASTKIMIEDYIDDAKVRDTSMLEYVTAINDNIKLASKIVTAEISLIIGIIVIYMFIGRFR